MRLTSNSTMVTFLASYIFFWLITIKLEGCMISRLMWEMDKTEVDAEVLGVGLVAMS